MRLILAPPIAVWVIWAVCMSISDRWSLLVEHIYIPITMSFASFIAGASCEGGGAVAFPVMTLLFDIHPHVARDFSLMIQSVGMSAAAVTIVSLGIKVSWPVIRCAAVAGAAGIVVGLDYVAPLLPVAYTKMFFVSLWLSFALVLHWVNRDRERLVCESIQGDRPRFWILIIAGFLGGIVSGITGSGLDIMAFTVMTLYFRVSEKTATPTSVILMALCSLVGFAWRGGIRGELDTTAWEYWCTSVPVVVVGAPLGAYFISVRTRTFIARFLYTSILVQFLIALLIVPQSIELLTFSATTLVVGICLFGCFSRWSSTRS